MWFHHKKFFNLARYNFPDEVWSLISPMQRYQKEALPEVGVLTLRTDIS
jgi:hypothetical protein